MAIAPRGADLLGFDWRISTAEVTAPGAFSKFPDTDRMLAIVSGKLGLSIEGRPTVLLDPSSDAVQFGGDVRTSATPIGGPVVDLNVMTRRGAYVTTIARHRDGDVTVLCRSDATFLVFALGEASISYPGGSCRLGMQDAVLFGVDDEDASAMITGTHFLLIEIFAVSTGRGAESA